MLETVIKYDVIFYLMGVAVAVGAIGKLISYVSVKKLVKASSEIQKSNHRLMRLVKAKFEHASMVSDKVQNIEAFAQKYLYEYKVLFASLYTWATLPVKMAWLSFVLGAMGAVACYGVQGMKESVFMHIGVAFVCFVFLISVHVLSDEKRKIDVVKNYIVEYLENVCVHRYEKANRVAVEAVADPVQVAIQEIEEENTPEEIVQEVREEEISKEETDTSKYRVEQEMRIRAILEEFLA